MQKPTRDELIAENAKLKSKVADLEAADGNVRESLSVALGAGTWKKSHYSEEEQVVFSWFSIFREIGKLLERKKQANLEEAFQQHERIICNLKVRIDELTDPKDQQYRGEEVLRPSNRC